MKYSVLLDSKYGQFIVERHDVYYPKYLLETDAPPAAHQVDFLMDMSDQLGDAPVFLDIGAHIGHFSIPFGKKFAKNKGIVYSFEVQRLIYYMLAGNIALNNLSNVYCFRKAIYQTSGEINLPHIDYYKDNNFGGYSLKNPAHSDEVIESVSIDDLKLDKVDIVKIDIEGLEEQALLGAANTLKLYKPLLFIEYDLSEPSLIDLIKSYGYLPYFYDGANCFCVHQHRPVRHPLIQLL